MPVATLRPLPPPVHVALVDPKTGMLTQPWQEYFKSLDAAMRALLAIV